MVQVLTTGELTVDLGSLVENYRTVTRELKGVEAAAMVKADGYGLGATHVAGALRSAGCSKFFVAQVEEGAVLRQSLPDAQIFVLNGAHPGTEAELVEHGLVPVLNSLSQIEVFGNLAASTGRRLGCALHFDTGMNRLGVGKAEAEILFHDDSLLAGLDVSHVMSHLASADEPDSDQPEAQLELFMAIRPRFPLATASLANSAGIFRGDEFHFDLGRPGIALYGGAPVAGLANPVKPVVSLAVPLLQVRDVEPGDSVGYGATHVFDQPGRVGTIAAGYGDGIFRTAGNSGLVAIGSKLAPVVGRISMDLTTIDVTNVGPEELVVGAPVELLGEQCLLDDVGERAGTISYEVLTNLGARYRRTYIS